MGKIICSVCGNEEDEYGQKYCSECGAEFYYMNEDIYFPETNGENASEKEIEVQETKLRNQNCKLTTGESFFGYVIVEYLDVLTVDEFIAFNGGHNNGIMYTSPLNYKNMMVSLKEVRQQLKMELQEKTLEFGGNALVGLSYHMASVGDSGMILSLSGTAVKIESN